MGCLNPCKPRFYTVPICVPSVFICGSHPVPTDFRYLLSGMAAGVDKLQRLANTSFPGVVRTQRKEVRVIAHEMSRPAVQGAQQKHHIVRIHRIVAKMEENDRHYIAKRGQQAKKPLNFLRRNPVLSNLPAYSPSVSSEYRNTNSPSFHRDRISTFGLSECVLRFAASNTFVSRTARTPVAIYSGSVISRWMF